MRWPTYDQPRTDREAEILADEIRRGLDELFETQLERDTDEMRDRALTRAARKLRGRP